MLPFPSKLQKGQLVKRYKRFFADVRLESGEIVVAHCPNTGSMKSCGSPGDTVLLSQSDNPKRKLKFTWELTQAKGGYIGVNTARPNHIVFSAIQQNKIPELTGYSEFRKEVKYGTNSRIDIFLGGSDQKACYVEVKNTTFLRDKKVVFPDAVTSRGLKHLNELIKVAKSGNRAVMFYLINRPEGDGFAPAHDIDPEYALGLSRAMQAGVEVLAYRAKHTVRGSVLTNKVDLNF